MKSETTAEFWKAYSELDIKLQKSARKAYSLWIDNPFHPSLRFKCVNSAENVWSVRISKGCHPLGIMTCDVVVWFWIGGHDDYEKNLG